MRKTKKLHLMLVVVALLVSVVGAAFIWAAQATPTLAVPDALPAVKSVSAEEAPP